MINIIDLNKKRGQVTIFIIVGIIIVASIVFIFLMNNNSKISNINSENPHTYIEKCVKDKIEPVIENMLSNGGIYYDGTNKKDFFIYNETKYPIFCYTNVSKTYCVNNYPKIIKNAREIIKENSISSVNSCFNNLKNKYKNSEINMGSTNVDLSISNGFIKIKIDKPFYVTDGENSYSFSNFDSSINSKLYDFLELSNLISNAEASCDCNSGCDVNLMNFNRNYADYTFTRKNLESGEKIYTISYLGIPAQNFSFYIKNCFTDVGINDEDYCFACNKKGESFYNEI